MKIKLHERFQTVFPLLEENEFKLLEADILKNGVREALIVWKGYLVDGHNRHKICSRHKLDFKTKELPEKMTEDEVVLWIINNQLARRNLTPLQRTVFMGMLYNARKQSHGGSRSSSRNDNLKTCELVARDFKVSANTVIRAGLLAEAMERIVEVGGEKIREKILNHELPIGHETIIHLSKIENSKELAAKVRQLLNPIITYAKPKKLKDSRTIDVKDVPEHRGPCPHCGKTIYEAQIEWTAG